MKDLDWYVLVVSPLCEKAVASRLTRRLEVHGVNVWTYVPVVVDRVRRRHRKNVEVERLVLPRYLFVGFDAAPRWYDVRAAMGVRGVIGIDGVPARLSSTVVGDLMSKCASGYFDGRLAPTPPKVQRGMRVVVADGPFRGYEGDVVDIIKSTRSADVLFEMFESQTVAKIHLDDLVSVSYASRRMIG